MSALHVLDSRIGQFIRNHLAFIIKWGFNFGLWLHIWWIGLRGHSIWKFPVDRLYYLNETSINIVNISCCFIIILECWLSDWIDFFLLSAERHISPIDLPFIEHPFHIRCYMRSFHGVIHYLWYITKWFWAFWSHCYWWFVSIRYALLLESDLCKSWIAILMVSWSYTVKSRSWLRAIVDAHLEMRIFMIMPDIHEFFPMFIHILGCDSYFRIIILCIDILNTHWSLRCWICKVCFHMLVENLVRWHVVFILFLSLIL